MNSSLAFIVVLAGAGTFLTGCASAPSTPPNHNPKTGRYYLNDGPLKGVSQATLDAIPEPTPRREVLSKGAKKPYAVAGSRYVPMTALAPYRARGTASWYGTRYHGSTTATGELYDMLKMTAAHPTLPLPSYARVTNLENNRSVIVRVNDRGPFLERRIIDLSFAAAARLGYLNKGSARSKSS
jgi:rare lipoprotein A